MRNSPFKVGQMLVKNPFSSSYHLERASPRMSESPLLQRLSYRLNTVLHKFVAFFNAEVNQSAEAYAVPSN